MADSSAEAGEILGLILRADALRRILKVAQKWQGNPDRNHSWRFSDVSWFQSPSKGRASPHMTAALTTLFLSPALSDQAVSHFVRRPGATRGMPPAKKKFLCTFCWAVQFSPPRPRLIGNTYRVACETCWKSVLDLSICWVCGEFVVRGEEVVSLGWCFWHRSCFGCLLCGSGLDPPPKKVNPSSGRVAEDGGFIGRLDLGLNQRRRAVELDYIPLCSSCEVATSTYTLADYEIMDVALENVTGHDGGMSRSRAKMLANTKLNDPVELWTATMYGREKDRATSSLWARRRVFQRWERHCQRCIQYTADHRIGATNMGLGRDGNVDEISNYSGPAESSSSLPGPLYQPALDPVVEPSLRQSRTNPLPGRIPVLTSNRNHETEQFNVTESSPKMRNTVHDSTFVFANEPHQYWPNLDAINATSSHPSYPKEMKGAIETAPESLIRLDMGNEAILEPTISKNCEIEVPSCNTSSNFSAAQHKQSSTPYPSNISVYRSSSNLIIPMSLLSHPTPATTTQAIAVSADSDCLSTPPSQVASPLVSGSERVRKRDASGELKTVMRRFKRQKLEGATFKSKKKSLSSKEPPPSSSTSRLCR